MKTRELGTSGLTVSAIGLGCMGMSQSYGAGDDEESIRTIHRALDLGVTFLDTADAYGKRCERSARGPGDQVDVDAKWCSRRSSVSIPGPSGPATDVDARPERVKAACEASLGRLGVDVIDLYYAHRVDPKVPIEATVGAMAELVREGKVRFLGLSEAGPDSLRRACRIHPIAALQSEYSLWTRLPERAVLPACRELGIGFVPFSPLGRGFLSGAVKDLDRLAPNDVRRSLPRFQDENLQHNVGARPTARRDGPGEGVLGAAAGARLVAREGPGHRPDSRDETPAVPRRERGSDRDRPHGRGRRGPRTRRFRSGSAAGERYPPASMTLVETERAR